MKEHSRTLNTTDCSPQTAPWLPTGTAVHMTHVYTGAWMRKTCRAMSETWDLNTGWGPTGIQTLLSTLPGKLTAPR